MAGTGWDAGVTAFRAGGSGTRSGRTTAARTFRGQDHLQKFIGVFEKFPKLIALCAKNLGRELRGHFDAGHGGIFGHITNLVHLDTGVAGQSGFQLLRE